MKYAFLAILLLMPFRAYSGTFTAVHHGVGGHIVFSGEITPGDATRFVEMVRRQPLDFLRSSYLELDSPGGSVSEALKLADQIEKSGFIVQVDSGQTCASACFLLFISGQFRVMQKSGQVLLHRPYINSPRHDLNGYEADRKLQQATTKKLRDFLEERAVPSSLIDKMMNLPSTYAYLLTPEDMHSGVHYMSPYLEELTIRRCGLTNENFLTLDRDTASDYRCIKHFAFGLNMDYIKGIIGEKRFNSVFEEYKNLN